jgi:hypothetical protein
MPNPFQLGLFNNGLIPQDASAFTLDSLPYAYALTFKAYVNSKLIGPQIFGLDKSNGFTDEMSSLLSPTTPSLCKRNVKRG